jgi:hypothetical protein
MEYGVFVDHGVRCWILVAEFWGSIPGDCFCDIIGGRSDIEGGGVLPGSSFLILIAIPPLSLPPAVTLCDVP